MPSGLATEGCDAEAAPGDVTEFRKAGLCAVKSCTRPFKATAWLPAAANVAGTAKVAPSGSMESTDPSGALVRASGAPKLDVLVTSTRLGSRIRPGWVNAANSGLSRIGPPG